MRQNIVELLMERFFVSQCQTSLLAIAQPNLRKQSSWCTDTQKYINIYTSEVSSKIVEHQHVTTL